MWAVIVWIWRQKHNRQIRLQEADFHTFKETVDRMKRQSMEWETMVAAHTPNMWLIYKIEKRRNLSQQNQEQYQKPWLQNEQVT